MLQIRRLSDIGLWLTVCLNIPLRSEYVEVLLILLPLFLLFPVLYFGLIAVSVRAKRREAETSKALSPEASED